MVNLFRFHLIDWSMHGRYVQRFLVFPLACFACRGFGKAVGLGYDDLSTFLGILAVGRYFVLCSVTWELCDWPLGVGRSYFVHGISMGRWGGCFVEPEIGRRGVLEELFAFLRAVSFAFLVLSERSGVGYVVLDSDSCCVSVFRLTSWGVHRVVRWDLTGLRSSVFSMTVSVGCRLLAAVSSLEVLLWSISGGVHMRRLVYSGFAVVSWFVSCGRFVVLGTLGGAVALFDVATGEEKRRCFVHRGCVWFLCGAYCGAGLVSGGAGRCLNV